MIELHERLSEFSYGYGVTREIEGLLESVGLKTAPFLPSLLQEAQLGFDVGFDKPGAVLLVQFKLGQSLQRFVRTKGTAQVPLLSRPFWRFNINTAEPEGQYETLLKAEGDGAEVYYAAPRFVDWSDYLAIFEAKDVLNRSLLFRPTEVRDALVRQRAPDGAHKVAYDEKRVHVCSEPAEIQETAAAQLASTVRSKMSVNRPLRTIVKNIFIGFDHRYLVRRPQLSEGILKSADDKTLEHAREFDLPRSEAGETRVTRLEKLRNQTKSEDDAVSAAVGLEVWSLGIQMILATEQ